jgi:hypothetical protein
MKDRLNELLASYRSRPTEQGDQSLWQFARERDPYLFSHHPADAKFREHVWDFGGLYFCKGCVVTFFGALLGAAAFGATRWLYAFPDGVVGMIFVCMLLPTLVAHLGNLGRVFRHGSRFLLGVLLVSAFLMLFVTDSWLVRGVIVASYFGGKIPLERKRNRENQAIACGCRKATPQPSGE